MRSRIYSLRLLTLVLFVGHLSICQLRGSDARETPLVRAIRKAQTAVVNIHSEKTATDKDSLFGGTPGRKVNGMGTGIVVDERGYIVTNQHVIAEVDSLRVTLQDGSSFNARVIASDRKTDLAIIKIDSSQSLPVMPLGTSSDLMLGESVIAIGNAFGYEHTVTQGIVSSLSRDVEVNETQAYKNLLQTDASINPGNSGGPLLNLDGDVVGINVAIRAGAQRIGFAIPVDDARKIIAKLLNVRKLGGAYHGVVAHDVKKRIDRMQLVVDGVEANSPAATAGFQPGDVIVQAGHVVVIDQADFERAMVGRKTGEAVPVVVTRQQVRVNLNLELGRDNSSRIAALPTSQQIVVRANNPEGEDSSWRQIGVRLSQVPGSQLGSFSSRYEGGLRVTEVRPNSPAAKNGVLVGDILVGLHVYYTKSPDNVAYVVNDPKVETFGPINFWVLRNRADGAGAELLRGNLKLASAK